MGKKNYTSIILLFILLTGWVTAYAQTNASELSKDYTLDMVTWNLEWFGAPGKSYDATSFDQQLESVSNQLLEMNADIYALQEVVVDDLNGDFFTPLLDALNEDYDTPRYIGFLADKYSLYWNSPTTSYPAQRICFIVDSRSVCVVDEFSMFEDVYDGYSTSSIDGYDGTAKYFWASGRLPQMMNSIVTVDGVSEYVNFINIHAKCCSSSEDRRQYDADYLYSVLVADYPDDNIIILGDYNDDMVTNPYASWYADDNKDYTLVASNEIDHISVSNELEDEFDALTDNVDVEDVSISDHDPVELRLLLNSTKNEQSITMDDVDDQENGSIVNLNATNSSGLDVQFQVIDGDAEVNANQLSCNGVGDVLVRAYQEGNIEYAPAFSNIVSFNVSNSTGINENKQNTVSVYPNPADNFVNVKVEGGNSARVEIYNISGSLVESIVSDGSDRINIGELPNGVYFVSVTSGDKKIVKRLVIRH